MAFVPLAFNLPVPARPQCSQLSLAGGLVDAHSDVVSADLEVAGVFGGEPVSEIWNLGLAPLGLCGADRATPGGWTGSWNGVRQPVKTSSAFPAQDARS